MAVVATHLAMSHDDNASHTHPFFSKTQNLEHKHMNLLQQPADSKALATVDEPISKIKDASKLELGSGKRKEVGSQQTLLQRFVIQQNVKDIKNTADLDSDPNSERRKRAKTASPEPEQSGITGQQPEYSTPYADKSETALNWRAQLQVEAQKGTVNRVIGPADKPHADEICNAVKQEDEANYNEAAGVHALERPLIENRKAPASLQPSQPAADVIPSPRSMRLKGGKLASPRAVRQAKTFPNVYKSNSLGNKTSKALLVKISYSQNDDGHRVGQRIQDILNGTDRVSLRLATLPQSKAVSKRKVPSKPTHPFFMSKVAAAPVDASGLKPAETSALKKKHISVASPRKAAALSNTFRTRQTDTALPELSSLVSRKSDRSKQIGGVPPVWPTRDNVHVRGLEHQDPGAIDCQSTGFVVKSSKRKTPTLDCASHFDIDTCTESNDASNLSPLRIPERLITTGVDIQSHIAKSLHTSLANKEFKQSTLDPGLYGGHAALQAMYLPIAQELTPFDRFECEPRAWTHKYAPGCVTEVLQTGKEAVILRDLLQRSTVNAVQTSSTRSNASSIGLAKTNKEKPGKKKRKRKDDLDGFLALSDDDLGELDLEHVDDDTRHPNFELSLARGGNNFAQAPVLPGCAVLLSGPHGCGKTATVYAVAQELGFEVFELNSATRRSGKDVLEKVGDMTGNHQVQRHISKALAEDKIPLNLSPEGRTSDETEPPDAKQKNVASFFKSVAPTKESNVTKKSGNSGNQPNKEIAAVKRVQQKQSLILLEEVDVLYEEDKQFWLTILTMVLYSRRPIIMTCNNERFIPESLNFQAILRFVPPPVQLATDYLLLIGAREGHLCSRNAIESLYKSKRHDLRASITELDFWCQMGVGDPTKGFNWMIERYPPGVDKDAQGRTLRVSSRNTFLQGMGVVTQDVDASCISSNLTKLEDIWLQASEEWNLDCLTSSLEQKELLLNDQADRLHELDLWVLLSDATSVSDMCFGHSMRQPLKQRFDNSIPPLTDKARANYCLGVSGTQSILQTDPFPEYFQSDKRFKVAADLQIMNALVQGRSDSSWPKSNATQQVASVLELSYDPYRFKSELSRTDFATAFDALASDPDDVATQATLTFPVSSFDREFSIITTELAPYIRSIAYEYQRREQEQIRLSSILSAGGQAKRRQTRAAKTAIEGGRRQDQRRARYFEKLGNMGINWTAITTTAGQDWAQRSPKAVESTADDTCSIDSAYSTDEEEA